jgi:hypothetical protein
VIFEYAVAAAFLVMGVLVLRGLRRFTVTTTALAVLLICMLLFGSALEGDYTVSHVVTESDSIAINQVQNVTAINLFACSTDGDINIYFSNSASQIYHSDFLQQYGPVPLNGGVSYFPRFSTDTGEPPTPNSTFGYIYQDGVVNVTAWTFYNNIDITLNQNYAVNLSCHCAFGNIVVHVPAGVNVIKASDLHSYYGTTETVYS